MRVIRYDGKKIQEQWAYQKEKRERREQSILRAIIADKLPKPGEGI